MRSIAVRQRLARAAAIAVSAALVAACSPGRTPANPGGLDPGGATVASGVLVISDGSNKVLVGDHAYTFPTTVTDAALSPDGSRIAFVDGDGNIATAHLDGQGMVALTKPLANGSRSRPAWRGARIVFSEKLGGATSQLRQVSTAGTGQAAFKQVYDGKAWHTAFLTDSGETDAPLGEPDDGRQYSSAGDNPSGSTPVFGPTRSAMSTGGDGPELAYERDGTVYLSDLNARMPYAMRIDLGSEPAVAADSSKVAYVKDGQIWVWSRAQTGEGHTAQVTFDAKSPTRLAFSPDGLKIAFSTPSDVETVAASVASGATSNPATVVHAKPGVASFVGATRDQVIHLSGSDAVATSIAASQARWVGKPDGLQEESDLYATQLLLVGTDNAGLMLAGAQMVDGGPVLVTTGSSLDPRTAGEIKRLFGKPHDHGDQFRVTIVGGSGSVPSSVDSAIRKLGYAVSRVTATDAVSMALKANGRARDATVALVVDSHDVASYASAISAFGAYSSQSVLLTNGTTLPSAVRSYLNAMPSNAPIYGVGAAAQQALRDWSSSRWTPMGGDSRTPTASLLANFSAFTDTLVVTPAGNSGDVLAAIGFARAHWAPVLVIDPDHVDPSLLDWLDKASGQLSTVVVVDSTGALTADVEKAVTGAVSGPLGTVATTNPKAAAP